MVFAKSRLPTGWETHTVKPEAGRWVRDGTASGTVHAHAGAGVGQGLEPGEDGAACGLCVGPSRQVLGTRVLLLRRPRRKQDRRGRVCGEHRPKAAGVGPRSGPGPTGSARHTAFF